jgi:hypothetical protein
MSWTRAWPLPLQARPVRRTPDETSRIPAPFRRHYGHLARDAREYAIQLLDAFNPESEPGTLVDARWTRESERPSVLTTESPPEQAEERSPLTDSNRRPPPYHGTTQATGRNRRQRFFAYVCGFRGGPICDGLPPVATAGLHKGSILRCLIWRRCAFRERFAKRRSHSRWPPPLRPLGCMKAPSHASAGRPADSGVSTLAQATPPSRRVVDGKIS